VPSMSATPAMRTRAEEIGGVRAMLPSVSSAQTSDYCRN